MGRRPTHRNESQHLTSAKAGVHVREELDSRFRGNDVTSDGVFMGLWPTRGHQNHPCCPEWGHAMACPYNGRRRLIFGGADRRISL